MSTRTGQVLLYLHMPKSGGTSLASCIYDQCSSPVPNKGIPNPQNPEKFLFHEGVYYFWGSFLKNRELAFSESHLRALGRDDLRAVVGHFWFGVHKHVNGDSVYATMLRDPVERVISLHAHLTEHAVRRKLPYTPMSLYDFATRPPLREVDNDQTRRIAGEEPEVGECSRRLLEKAKENLRTHFGAVGITERFDETLVLFKHVFGWSRPLTYYPKNVSRPRPNSAVLPRATIDAIRDRNTLDLELYAFAKEMLDESLAAQGSGFHEELAEFKTRHRAFLDETARRLSHT
jgi:hypothetical protein